MATGKHAYDSTRATRAPYANRIASFVPL